MKQNWKFQGLGGSKPKTSLGEVWIFSGTTHSYLYDLPTQMYYMSNSCFKADVLFLQAFLDVVVNLQFTLVESLWQTFWRHPSEDKSSSGGDDDEKKDGG